MYILGINAYHGDAAAAIIHDGELVAAVEEERFNRIKHCAGFPTESVRYCLKAADISVDELAHIGISRDPSAHLHKKILFAARSAARGISDFGFRNSNLAADETAIRRSPASPALLDSRGRSVNKESVLVANGNPKSAIQNSKSRDGNGRGLFRHMADRLGNAARVHDLKEDLARGPVSKRWWYRLFFAWWK